MEGRNGKKEGRKEVGQTCVVFCVRRLLVVALFVGV